MGPINVIGFRPHRNARKQKKKKERDERNETLDRWDIFSLCLIGFWLCFQCFFSLLFSISLHIIFGSSLAPPVTTVQRCVARPIDSVFVFSTGFGGFCFAFFLVCLLLPVHSFWSITTGHSYVFISNRIWAN